MKKVVSIGAQYFASLRERECFYIDKTDFIKEWWENEDAVTLITRPRRFGKTLNMSMLECFFSEKYAKRTDLFEGLSIWSEEKYRKLQGRYPVIFLSFANVKGNTYSMLKTGLVHIIVDLYGQNSFLREALSENEQRQFDAINDEMSEAVMMNAIQRLCTYLERYYGKKVLIFLDEYDTPLQEAYVSGCWQEMVNLIRIIFNSTFKTNPSLEKAVLTGITRVSKESIFSDLNNLEVVTTTFDKYETAFGFTEREVFEALDSFGMSDKKTEIKTWYDGFTFGKVRDIYNPWSITNFLDKGVFSAYWANTSSNSLVGTLIQRGDEEIKVTMESLLAGKTFQTEIDEQIIFQQLDYKNDAIWSLLLASGYLKVVNIKTHPRTRKNIYELGVTNLEVRLMFEDMIRDWFSNYPTKYNDFIRALFLNDIKYMNRFMNKVAQDTFSFFDTGKKPSKEAEPERFYHGFVLGLIVDLIDRYHITSNRESGFGRYDVMLEPLDKERDFAYIFEFKVHDSDDEKTLEDTVKSALEQIEEKNYDAILLAKGVKEDKIRHYGFAFEGKKVLIG